MATSLSAGGPPSNTWFLQPIQAHNPNGIAIGLAISAQMTAESPYTLQWDAPLPPQNCPFPWGIWTPSTWFSGLTRVLDPNVISIGAAVFARLTSVTDRQTERPTDHATRSVTIGCIYVRSTAMQPKNVSSWKKVNIVASTKTHGKNCIHNILEGLINHKLWVQNYC